MLKLCGFCVVTFQLCFGVATGTAWFAQRTPFSSSLENRVYLQITPPGMDPYFFDPGDPGKWGAHPYTDPKSKQRGAASTSVGLWFTDSLILSMLKTQCDRLATSLNPAFHAPCSINTMHACFRAGCLIRETLLMYFTHSDGFRFQHKDLLETEIMSNQQHMTLRTGNTESSHQIIVIMEEEPAVIETATYLFQRHPTMSTLLKYWSGVLYILRGSHSFSSKNHNVILVGHGSKRTNGTVHLAGSGPEELARVVLQTESIFGHVDTICLISCNLGNEPHFMRQMLQVLRSANVEPKLYLFNSLLSVSSDGQIMTSTDRVWRAHDNSRRVIAELDQKGDLLTRVELGCAGPVLHTYKGYVLYLQTLEWPSQPQMFVPKELRKKYPSIDCLEGLTWSLFFEENERRRAPDYVPDQTHLTAIWLTEPGPQEDNIIFKHISSIQDLLVEIRYNAREEVASDLYYVLNECIYKVDRANLNVSLAGKFMNPDNQAEIEHFRQTFNEQQGNSSLLELTQGLKPYKFNDFCRQTFQFQQCNYNCERWGHYFMTAVFSASVRNFRTFSLFLMSVIGCEVGHLRGTDSQLCTAFVGPDHPMVTDQPWPDILQRGFYGCTVENYEMAPLNRQIWLDQVVAKENALYIKSKQIMGAVGHDEQTELEIFGKVKVMNKYVFSSYLEFFRGTPEGKKLKIGCASSFYEHLNP